MNANEAFPDDEGCSTHMDSENPGVSHVLRSKPHGGRYPKRSKIWKGTHECPVCGLSLHPSDLEEHLQKELHKLMTRRASLDVRRENRRRESVSDKQEFRRVICNRAIRRHERSLSVCSDDVIAKCPLCQEEVVAPAVADLEEHVTRCLTQQEGLHADSEEEMVDIDGPFEVYEWCGETRVRATALLQQQGQLHAIGTQVLQGAEDEVVEVCDDEVVNESFGPSQYAPEDVNDILHKTVTSPLSATDIEEGLVSKNENIPMLSDHNLQSEASCSSGVPDDRGSPQAVIAALKTRILELEDEQNKLLCHVCHGDYDTPVVSVVCWHVYCEKCWLASLAARKLCPQCSCIISPRDLRRIYL